MEPVALYLECNSKHPIAGSVRNRKGYCFYKTIAGEPVVMRFVRWEEKVVERAGEMGAYTILCLDWEATRLIKAPSTLAELCDEARNFCFHITFAAAILTGVWLIFSAT